MDLRMIVAVDQANAIGWVDGRLPWRSSVDMARFKALTSAAGPQGLASTVVMGFNTYASLKRPLGLPNRRNIVLTRHRTGQVDPLVETVGSLTALLLLHDVSWTEHAPWLIGGAAVYAQAIEQGLVRELHLTQVHLTSEADVSLPFELYDWKRFVHDREAAGETWRCTAFEQPAVEPPQPTVTFITLERDA